MVFPKAAVALGVKDVPRLWRDPRAKKSLDSRIFPTAIH